MTTKRSYPSHEPIGALPAQLRMSEFSQLPLATTRAHPTPPATIRCLLGSASDNCSSPSSASIYRSSPRSVSQLIPLPAPSSPQYQSSPNSSPCTENSPSSTADDQALLSQSRTTGALPAQLPMSELSQLRRDYQSSPSSVETTRAHPSSVSNQRVRPQLSYRQLQLFQLSQRILKLSPLSRLPELSQLSQRPERDRGLRAGTGVCAPNSRTQRG